jgi:hypothetical protein
MGRSQEVIAFDRKMGNNPLDDKWRKANGMDARGSTSYAPFIKNIQKNREDMENKVAPKERKVELSKSSRVLPPLEAEEIKNANVVKHKQEIAQAYSTRNNSKLTLLKHQAKMERLRQQIQKLTEELNHMTTAEHFLTETLKMAEMNVPKAHK